MGYNNKTIVVYKDRYTIIRGKIYFYPEKDSVSYIHLQLCFASKRIQLVFDNKDRKTVMMNLIAKPSKTLALLNLKHYNSHISYIAQAILTNNYQLGEIA